MFFNIPQPKRFNVRGKFGSPMSEKYYNFLQVEPSATKKDIKSSYRKMATIYHPDRKTGDLTKFKKLQHIYETLTDDVKRICYDSFGPDYEDIPSIDHFKQSLKGKPKVIRITLTLGDIINGVTKHIKYNTYSRNGNSINSERDVVVTPGHETSKPLVFPGEGNDNNCSIRGDLVIMVEEIPDQNFKRVNNHLIAKIKCCVLSIIVNNPIQVLHPSGEELYVRLGHITENKMNYIKGKGVNIKGDLFIQVVPIFPDVISVKQKEIMVNILELKSTIKQKQPNHILESSSISIEQVESIIQSNNEESGPGNQQQEVGCPVQ